MYCCFHRIKNLNNAIKSQSFFIKFQGPKTRFLDTMSMHIATCGQTGFQRMLYMARRKNSRTKEVREMEDKRWGRGPPVS